jgi:hypothetical protein
MYQNHKGFGSCDFFGLEFLKLATTVSYKNSSGFCSITIRIKQLL